MIQKIEKSGDGLVYCSLETLLKQRAQAKRLQHGRRNIHACQTGSQLSVYKGRGMSFAESRPYQVGDDVRFLDWRVTARTGKAYSKLFEEERERTTIIWLDLRPPMFFATRGCYKSVMAANLASLLLWKNWLEGERVGGVIVDGLGNVQYFKSSRHLSALSRLLQTIAAATQIETKVQPLVNTPFIDALAVFNNKLEKGGKLFFISDFRGLNQEVERRLGLLQRYNRLFLLAISDPFEYQLPMFGKLRMRYAERLLTLCLGDQSVLRSYYANRQQREQQLTQLTQQLNIPLMQFSTADTPVEQWLTLVRGLR